MSDNTLLEILKVEYQRLRDDRRNQNNNLFQLFVLLLSISVLGVASVVQFKYGLNNNETSNTILRINSFWDIVTISYPFISYIFLSVFFVLSDAILHNSVALSLIEKKINEELKIHALNWEEMAVQNSLYKTHSTNLQATILIVVLFLSADIVCIYNSTLLFQDGTYQSIYTAVNCALLIIFLAMLVYHGFFERKKLRKKFEKKYFTVNNAK